MKIRPEDIRSFTAQHPLAMLYFKGDQCTVCRQLEPEIKAFADKNELPLMLIDMPSNTELAASEMVLSVPVVKVYFDGREIFKEGAYLRLAELQRLIDKVRTLSQ